MISSVVENVRFRWAFFPLITCLWPFGHRPVTNSVAALQTCETLSNRPVTHSITGLWPTQSQPYMPETLSITGLWPTQSQVCNPLSHSLTDMWHSQSQACDSVTHHRPVTKWLSHRPNSSRLNSVSSFKPVYCVGCTYWYGCLRSSAPSQQVLRPPYWISWLDLATDVTSSLPWGRPSDSRVPRRQ